MFGKYSFMKAQRALVLLWLHVRIVDLRDPFRTPVMRMSSLVRNMVQQEILLISSGFLTLESWQRKAWSRNPGDTLRIGSSIRTTRKKKTLPCYFFSSSGVARVPGPCPFWSAAHQGESVQKLLPTSWAANCVQECWEPLLTFGPARYRLLLLLRIGLPSVGDNTVRGFGASAADAVALKKSNIVFKSKLDSAIQDNFGNFF